MNRKHTLAVALALVGSAAFAQSNDVDLQNIATLQASTTTRAAVRAEVLQARRDGTLNRVSDVDNAPVASARSRDEVRKEAIAATRNGQASRSLQAGH
jgi:hypothetical protein